MIDKIRQLKLQIKECEAELLVSSASTVTLMILSDAYANLNDPYRSWTILQDPFQKCNDL